MVFEVGMTFHTYVPAPGFGMSETIAVLSESPISTGVSSLPDRLSATVAAA